MNFKMHNVELQQELLKMFGKSLPQERSKQLCAQGGNMGDSWYR